MNLQFHIPSFPLNKFVELFIFYENYYPGHRIERLLPEGVIEIIIDLTEIPKYIYDNHSLREKNIYKKAWISGFRKEYISISALPNSSMMVIRFKPGKASPFLQIPLNEITEEVVDADLIFGRDIMQLRDLIVDAPSIRQKFDRVEKFLLNKAKDHFHLKPAFLHVLNEIIQNPVMPSIDKAVNKSGHTHKHIISLFQKNVGVSPKQFLRIIRFQQAIKQIGINREVDWIDIAFQCGYYDQSHFINDFKQFSGFTPTQYLQFKREQTNYIPIK